MRYAPGTVTKIAIALLIVTLPAWPQGAAFPLPLQRLAGPLKLLTQADRDVVQDATRLIEDGKNREALVKLSELEKSHPDNSSLRILVAYATLQAGNLAAAFQEAVRAHETGNGSSYKCWFLAKIALLTGDIATCKREIAHAKKAGEFPDDVRLLEREMKTATAKRPAAAMGR